MRCFGNGRTVLGKDLGIVYRIGIPSFVLIKGHLGTWLTDFPVMGLGARCWVVLG